MFFQRHPIFPEQQNAHVIDWICRNDPPPMQNAHVIDYLCHEFRKTIVVRRESACIITDNVC